MALIGFVATGAAIAFTWKLAAATLGLVRGYFN